MRYFVTPTHCLKADPRVGSTSLAKAVVATFYAELLEGVNNALPDAERFTDPHVHKTLVPTVETPTKPVLMLLRDPKARKASAKAVGMQIEPQVKEGQVFRFPEEIPEFCKAAALPGLEHLNARG